MKTGAAGLALIKEFEGFRPEVYKCPAGFWTVGYGCRFYPDGAPVRKTDCAVTDEQGHELLAHCLISYEAAVENALTTEISQHQFDALVAFAYNCGTRAFCTSTLLKKVNANPLDPKIRDEFMRWTKVHRKPSRGLERRRRAEAQLYFKPASKPPARASVA